MELLIMVQTLRLDSAARVTAVAPYLCYTRSDKKDQPRVPITARLVADMIEVAGADRYMTFDLHADQIQGFFSIPGDVLYAFHVLIDYLETLCGKLHKPVVVAPDLVLQKNPAIMLKGLAFLWQSSRRDAPPTILLPKRSP